MILGVVKEVDLVDTLWPLLIPLVTNLGSFIYENYCEAKKILEGNITLQ